MVRCTGLLVSLLLVISAGSVQAQSEQSVRNLFAAGDLKKLDKADQYKREADKIMEDVNLLNIQILSIEADSSIPKSAIRKKVVPIENQSWQKLIQASGLYEKCNKIKVELYKQSIENFWDRNPGSETTRLNEKLLEEQASDLYFQALSYRTDARRMSDGQVKVSRLTDANNLESEAVDKLVTSLAGCNGIETAPAVTAEIAREIEEQDMADNLADSVLALLDSNNISYTLPAESGINRDVLASYNRYMNEGQRVDTSLSTGKLAGITSFDRDTVLRLWYEYLYGKSDTERIALSKPDRPITGEAERRDTLMPAVVPETEIGVVTAENRGTLVPADQEVIYRVQIAALRTELSQRALSRIYYGNKNVEMVNENGWFKYSIGDFTTFEEADKFRQSSGVSNAFVVAYRKGMRTTSETVLQAEREETAVERDTGLHLPEGLIYRIQVAASRVPFTVGQIEQINGSRYPVEVIREEGWYKYQLIGVRLFSDALQIKQSVSAKGAFIVAYNNGIKQNLAEAVNQNRAHEKEVQTGKSPNNINEIEFHVQLAATRRALKPAEIRALYTGSLTVSLVLDDGWYKYHLKTGNSYELAKKARQECGVNGSFIVAYRKAVKISLMEAVRNLK